MSGPVSPGRPPGDDSPPVWIPEGLSPPTEIGADGDSRIGFAQVGRYVVQTELGRGGMGIVFRGWDPVLSRTVAIKMMLGGGADLTLRDRLLREARAAAKLRHPAIVAIHEVGEHKGLPYLVMDYVDGETLESAPRRERIPARRAVAIARDVALALQHAHDNGIVHRDVKPGNVLLDREGRPHLVDFGLARMIDARTQLTATGHMIGTPGFLSPEQGRGDHARVGPRSDVFSLGAVLYYVLTGRAPFEGASILEVLRNVLQVDPVPLRRVDPRIHADLETIVAKCLEKPPEARFASADELAADLGRFLDGEAIRARPPGRVERAARLVRRHRAVAAALGALVLVVLAAAATGAIALRERARERRQFARELEQRVVEAERERALAEKERAAATRLLGRIFLERSRAAAQQGRSREAAIFAAKALSIEDRPEHRGAWAAARLGPWRRPRLLGEHGKTSPEEVAVAFAADGRRLTTVGARGTVTVWDTSGGEPERIPAAATKGLRKVSIAADGSRVAGIDGPRVVVRDASAQAPAVFDLEASVAGLALSPDGRLLVLYGRVESGRFGGTIIDLAAGRPVLSLDALGDAGQATEMALSADGRLLALVIPDAGKAATTFRDNRVEVWDLARGSRLAAVGGGGPVACLAFSRDAGALAWGTAGGLVKAWDWRTNRTTDLEGHASSVRAVAFDRTGRRLASSSADGTARVWHAPTGRLLAVLAEGVAAVDAVAFHPDGSALAAASGDGTVRVWELSDARREVPLERATEDETSWTPLDCFAFGADGRRAAIATGREGLEAWDTATGRSVLAVEGRRPPAGPITDMSAARVALSADGRRVAAATTKVVARATVVVVRECGSGALVRRWTVPEYHWRTIAVSADAEQVAVSSGGVVQVTDLASGEASSLPVGEGTVMASAFDPTGRRIAVGMKDGRIEVRSLDDPDRVARFEHADQVSALAFDPAGRRLASAGHDRAVRIWDLERGVEIEGGARHGLAALAVAWSPDGRHVLSGGADATVRIWDAGTLAPVATIDTLAKDVEAIAWSAEGGRILARGPGRSIEVWALGDLLDAAGADDVLDRTERATGLRIPDASLDPVPLDD